MRQLYVVMLVLLLLNTTLPVLAAENSSDPIGRLLPGDPLKFQEEQNPTFQKVAGYPIDFLYWAFFWVSVLFTIYDFLKSRVETSVEDHETKKKAINSIFKGIGLFVGLIVVLRVILPTLSSMLTG